MEVKEQQQFVMFKPHKKNKWTAEEDKLLKEAVAKHGSKNWGSIARHIPGRTGKQCRERWIFGLDPNVNKDTWTKEEDDKLIELQHQYGNKWSKFLQFLPGRSSSGCKNRWSLLNRRGITNNNNNAEKKRNEPHPLPVAPRVASYLSPPENDTINMSTDELFDNFGIFEEDTQFLFYGQKSDLWFD